MVHFLKERTLLLMIAGYTLCMLFFLYFTGGLYSISDAPSAVRYDSAIPIDAAILDTANIGSISRAIPNISIHTGAIKNTTPSPNKPTVAPLKQTVGKDKFLGHLKIPSIEIDAAIESLGLTTDGAMDVPKGPDNVAWFNLGTYPGKGGSAVIAGHHGWKNGRAAVFDNLYKLRAGDLILIEDAKGGVATFVVRETHIYSSDAYAPEIFTSATGTHLNLITCNGVWDRSAKAYPQRLVIFADIL